MARIKDADDKGRGLYNKYFVARIRTHTETGRSGAITVGVDVEQLDRRVFVLDPTKDPLARDALEMYAQKAQEAGFHRLSTDIYDWLLDLDHPTES